MSNSCWTIKGYTPQVHLGVDICMLVYSTHVHILLKLLDLAFESLDVGDEGDSV